MIIAGLYSFNEGMEVVRAKYPTLLTEIEEVIASIDAASAKTKTSKEITMPGKMLYSPRVFNAAFSSAFVNRGWHKQRVASVYSTQYYTPDFQPRQMKAGAF